ncbi:MAG: DUF3108 domain-containing protein [Candidatus Omnitrophica bacterium]|nr:DUF3108 domain-containing protein [Candidatus Omnitrophota bacterium]
MTKKILLVLLIIFISISASLVFGKSNRKSYLPVDNVQIEKVDYVKEKIVYNVQMGFITLGSSIFKFEGSSPLNGEEMLLMTFETRLARFFDLEKIYCNPVSFLPVKIERKISHWPLDEKITEEYDQKNFIVKINKVAGDKKEERVIKKDNVINNAILLPYFVRSLGEVKPDFNLVARFPLQDFVITLDGKEEVSVPAGKFMAYHFVSKPKRFEIWLSADKDRIPLKIKGANGLGYTLAMKERVLGE